MIIYIDNTWTWFCIAFAGVLVATYLMSRQSRHFYTLDVIKRRFTILDLEFAATAVEVANTLRGIFLLPAAEARRTERSLRAQLLTDTFLFMPFAYGSIFLLCMKTATLLNPLGSAVFVVLAWGQAIAFVLDLIENVYIWQKLRSDVQPSASGVHRAYQWLEGFKWGFATMGAIGAFSALGCLWLSGRYSADVLPYIFIFVGEVIVFIVLTMISRAKIEKEGVSRSEERVG